MKLFIIQILAILISLIFFWLFFLIFFKTKKDKKGKKTIWVKICPDCGSINVERMFLSGKIDKFWKAFNPVKYRCNSCKFEGIFPEANLGMIEEIQKSIRNKKVINNKKLKN